MKRILMVAMVALIVAAMAVATAAPAFAKERERGCPDKGPGYVHSHKKCDEPGKGPR